MNNLFQVQGRREAVLLLVVCIVVLLMVMGVAAVTYQSYPTFQQASDQILAQYPECRDQLELVVVTQQFGFTGPLQYPITGYFLECQAVNLSIRIQKPD